MRDLISRQAAIDALHQYFKDGFEEDRWWNSTHVLAALKGLPSAQPELTDEEKRLIKQLRSYHNGSYAKILDKLMPSAQPTKSQYKRLTAQGIMRKKGKWHSRFYPKIEMYVCSECQHEYSYDTETGEQEYNFCPNCGADMRGDTE